MTIEKGNTIILKLLQNSLFPQADDGEEMFRFKEEVDWDYVLKELEDHTVAVIPCEYVMKNLIVPAPIKQKWMNLAFYQVGQWTKMMSAQNELVRLMSENGIEMAIIKGSAAAILYPHPEYRTMGDIDFIVKREKFKQACQIMLENGYTFALGEEKGKRHLDKDKFAHTELEKNGLIFEIHKELVRIQNDEVNAYIKTLVSQGMENVEINTIEGYRFPMFPKTLNGLILLRHIVQHLTGEGLGLRQILDWMMFADRCLDDYYWKTEFEPIVSKAGLKGVAVTFTRMCQLYLGLKKENMTWCTEADEVLCEEWILTIMKMGNFGRKIKEENLGVNVILKNKNFCAFLKSLQNLGLEHWKMAEKYPVFRPFAWVYQICRYVKKALRRKAPIRSLRKDFEKSKERKDILEGLEIEGLQKEK